MRNLVVDTDVLINFFRQKNQPTLLQKLLADKKTKIFLAAVTITELWRGKSIENNRERQKVKDLLKKTAIVLANQSISQKAGELLRKYHHLMLADALVAATAINKKARLVSFNQKHFSLIKEINLYQL